jgi:uncharacterized repeat protein (TIGR03803 family)
MIPSTGVYFHLHAASQCPPTGAARPREIAVRPSQLLVLVLASLATLFLLINASPAQTVKVLYIFDGTVGSAPSFLHLTQGRDGQLYGTLTSGGTYDLGTIFKITTTGRATLLHSFNGNDGSIPAGGVILGVDGNFYGTTITGGTGYGLLYKTTPQGTVTILHYFANNGIDGTYPNSPPVLAADGNFYGATTRGGTNDAGAVYKYTPDGFLAVIYNYDPATSGLGPAFSPTQGSDGNLYVVTEGGRTCGSVIKISTAGVLRNTHVFDCGADGGEPAGGVFQGSDGNFYGALQGGAAYDRGALFKLSPSFDYSVLHSFGGTSDGIQPSGAVIQGTDGNFYGLDFGGGSFNDGTIYNYSLSGSYRTVYTWDQTAVAQGQLIQHTNGIFYGVTIGGGAEHEGSVFNLNVRLSPFVALVESQGRTGTAVQMLGQGFTGTSSVTFNGMPTTNFTVVKDTFLTAVVPAGATSGPVVVTTPKGPRTSNVSFRIVH